MDVARISPIPSNKIDWRNLTAKQIIKYEQQGVDVPSQYLQWAKEFMASVYSDDTTTYEMAVSESANSSGISNEQPAEVESVEGNAIVDETESDEDIGEGEKVEDSEGEGDGEENAAQLQRASLSENGVSLRRQAIIFKKESKKRFWRTLIDGIGVTALEKNSDTELQKLEHNMKALLSLAEATQNDFKAQVDSINNGSSDSATFANMNRLQERLERYANSGLTQISSSESDFSEYQASLDNKTDNTLDAAVYGAETSDIGAELLANRGSGIFNIDMLIGLSTIKSGAKTSAIADSVSNSINQATGTNISNFNSADSFKADIEDKTGVQSETLTLSSRHSKDDSQEVENQNDPANEEKAGTVEDENFNDPANSTSANLDKVLLYKIKRGINVDNPDA